MNILAALASLVIIGHHAAAGEVTPLYAVRVGDTTKAEVMATGLMEFFGPYAINGNIYTREGKGWRRTIFVRPASGDEAVEFLLHRAEFGGHEHVNRPYLMHGLGDLERRVSFAVIYFDGSAKLYLEPLTSKRDACAVARVVAAQ